LLDAIASISVSVHFQSTVPVFREMNRGAGCPWRRINAVFSHLTVLRAGGYYMYHVLNIPQHLQILRFATRCVMFLSINIYK
jgi:hypothetical protein